MQFSELSEADQDRIVAYENGEDGSDDGKGREDSGVDTPNYAYIHDVRDRVADYDELLRNTNLDSSFAIEHALCYWIGGKFIAIPRALCNASDEEMIYAFARSNEGKKFNDEYWEYRKRLEAEAEDKKDQLISCLRD